MATHLKNLVLHELSLVDHPANEASRVTLFKRNGAAGRYTSIEKGDLDDDVVEYLKRDFSQEERDKLSGTGAAMPDGSFPIKSVQDLKNAIRAVGRAKDPAAAKKHIVSRAKSLGAESELPDSWSGGKSAGSSGKSTTDEGGNSMSDNAKEIDALKAENDDLKKKLEDATKAKSAAEQAAKDAKDKAKQDAKDAEDAADQGDDEAMEKILARPGIRKSFDKRVQAEVAKITKAASEDEVIKVVRGEKTIELRKSVVGEQMFEFAKAQQEEIAKSRDEAELVTLAKRAETELGHLPGNPVAKAKVLKAINGMNEETQKQFLDMLKAGNAAMKSGFKPLGHNNGDVDATNPEVMLDKMADEHAQKHNVTKAAAYDAVLKTAEGKRLYRESLSASPAH